MFRLICPKWVGLGLPHASKRFGLSKPFRMQLTVSIRDPDAPEIKCIISQVQQNQAILNL